MHGWGYLAAGILLLLFVIINIVGIRYFARINNAITSWKVAIPIVTILILLIGHFHGSNFGHAGGGFFTSHNAIKNILLTVPPGSSSRYSASSRRCSWAANRRIPVATFHAR